MFVVALKSAGFAVSWSRTASLEIPTSRPRGDCCLGFETCGEADVATGACSLGSWGLWRCGRKRCGWRCVGRGFGSGAPAFVLVEHVGRLDPVGRRGDGLAAHQELQ
jgi:hypothetical protein